MKIIVCVKIIKGEINPFDACALEEALRISNDVTVVSMGPPTAKDALLPLTRLGAKVIMLSDSAFAGSDTLATSYILSTALKKLEYDLILCGRQTIDGDTAQVGPCLSKMLGVNLITNALEIKVDSEVRCKTRMGDERVPLPALVTVERINNLRFPSIFSRLGEVEIWDNAVLGCDESRIGLKGSPTRVLKVFESERGKRRCKFISKDELFSLVEHLSLENARSEKINESQVKLKKILAVGDEVLEAAHALGETVIKVCKTDVDAVIERIRKEDPDAVLWNADLWGRKNAPIAAAVLETGLCADCVNLETDGNELYMYRPASSGNIIAKIKCNTRPQMATVRTIMPGGDIVVGIGKGVCDVEKAAAFSKKLGAELCASRAAVDAGTMPYEAQVGLTGRMICPKVYIAVGISGAVQHTCGIENAKTVIAVNTDKDARIFDFADYGIVDAAENLFKNL